MRSLEPYQNGVRNNFPHEKEVEQIIQSINCLKEKLKVFETGSESTDWNNLTCHDICDSKLDNGIQHHNNHNNNKNDSNNSLYYHKERPSRDSHAVETDGCSRNECLGIDETGAKRKRTSSIRRFSNILKSKSNHKQKSDQVIVETRESVDGFLMEEVADPEPAKASSKDRYDMLIGYLNEMKETTADLHNRIENVVEQTCEFRKMRSSSNLERIENMDCAAAFQKMHRNLLEKVSAVHRIAQENSHEHKVIVGLLEKIDKKILALRNLMERETHHRKSTLKFEQTDACKPAAKSGYVTDSQIISNNNRASGKFAQGTQTPKTREKPGHRQVPDCGCSTEKETERRKSIRQSHQFNQLYDGGGRNGYNSDFSLLHSNESDIICKSPKNNNNTMMSTTSAKENGKIPDLKAIPSPPKKWISESNALEAVTIVHEPIRPKTTKCKCSYVKRHEDSMMDVSMLEDAPADNNHANKTKHNKQQQTNNGCFSFCRRK